MKIFYSQYENMITVFFITKKIANNQVLKYKLIAFNDALIKCLLCVVGHQRLVVAQSVWK